MSKLLPSVGRLAGGAVLLAAAGFAAVARWRGARALHPVGTVTGATVVREGLDPGVGVPWLDEPGEDAALVRFSRAIGVPAPLPDVLGLAIRVPGSVGRPQDLLLSSAGQRPVLRHLLQPRRGIHDGGYTSILPFLSPSGPVMIGAFPSGTGFDLEVAGPGRGWRRFGRLLLDPEPLGADGHQPAEDLPDEPGADEEQPDRGGAKAAPLRLERVPEDARPDDLAPDDPGLDFDPVLHPIPGLRLPDPLARLRSVIYAASRRGRGER
ncbi:MAG TPA: hypothetical protein VFP72_02535 [Kineosporiaceae bacterium]|nr:hypothetical protein [Kineosporiaceae bacterium]